MEALEGMVPRDQIQSLEEMRRMIENHVQEQAERQGLKKEGGRYQLTAQAYRVFQGKLLSRIFSDLQASKSGRHINDITGEGAVELQETKPYEFGDFLSFIEMYTFGKVKRPGEIIDLMPKNVTIHDPVVRLKVDMANDNVSEHMVHRHFTNIQHSLQLARQLLAAQDTPNRQVILITDGLPTAHFEGSELFMLYPPHPKTEEVTMREGAMCARDGITINMFLVPGWSQSEEDIRFAYRLAESTKGRVIFTSGGDLDRFVIWDYIDRKREIIG